ncbi:MAG: gas vesicle protein K [Desulfobacteraceae bacterium]|nr:MAG: gas vesicle protein K [Desulfobacteraceae bacterium]
MSAVEQPKVESETLTDFVRVMDKNAVPAQSFHEVNGRHARIELDPEKAKNGLGQLVLTLVKVIHELLELQAIRRIDAGSLMDEEIENIGMTLMRQAEEIDRLRKVFNLEEDDLNIDLGPLGKLL